MLNERLTLTIQNLEVQALVGVYNHEKETPQTIYLTIHAVYRKIPNEDSIETALDYDSISAKVQEECKKHQWALIETLALDIAHALYDPDKLKEICVEVSKPAAAKKNHAREIICRYTLT